MISALAAGSEERAPVSLPWHFMAQDSCRREAPGREMRDLLGACTNTDQNDAPSC